MRDQSKGVTMEFETAQASEGGITVKDTQSGHEYTFSIRERDGRPVVDETGVLVRINQTSIVDPEALFGLALNAAQAAAKERGIV